MKRVVLFLAICLGTVFAEEEYLPESVLLDHHFLMYRRGDNRRLLEDTQMAPSRQNLNVSSRLNPIQNFRRVLASRDEGLRAMIRSYIREITSSSYYVAPATRFPDADPGRNLSPVLHFIDGDGAYHILIRVNESRFDLVVLRPAHLEDGTEGEDYYSSHRVEHYPLERFVELARLSKNRVLAIGVYEDGSNDPPHLSGRQIPIEPVDLLALEDEMREYMVALSPQTQPQSMEALSRNRMLNFLEGLEETRQYEARLLEERKNLIRMRLPWLDLSPAHNLEQLSVIVQGAIIEKIYEPSPLASNCPGEIVEGNRCRPTTEWTDKTWELYRELYRISDLAGAIYDGKI